MAKNIFIVLGLATVAFAGYYMYTTQGSSVLNTDNNEAVMQNMLSNTQVFIQRRQELSRIDIGSATALFEDERFLSLVTYTDEVAEQPVGRGDPFAETGFLNNTTR